MRYLDGGREQQVVIVGHDEADPAAGRIAFAAPLARALAGAAEGDMVPLPAARWRSFRSVRTNSARPASRLSRP